MRILSFVIIAWIGTALPLPRVTQNIQPQPCAPTTPPSKEIPIDSVKQNKAIVSPQDFAVKVEQPVEILLGAVSIHTDTTLATAMMPALGQEVDLEGNQDIGILSIARYHKYGDERNATNTDL